MYGKNQSFWFGGKVKMEEFVEILNENTDNGCFYEVITIKNH